MAKQKAIDRPKGVPVKNETLQAATARRGYRVLPHMHEAVLAVELKSQAAAAAADAAVAAAAAAAAAKSAANQTTATPDAGGDK